MGLAVLMLTAAVLGLWSALAKLRRRLDSVENKLASREAADNELALVHRRLGAVEASLASGHVRAETPAPSSVSVPSAPSEAVRPPATEPPVMAAPRLAAAPASDRPDVTESPAPAEPAVPGAPAPLVAAPSEADGWEVTVGTSWLNKIGVLVTVMGIALMVGYSMTNVGPGGRVALGYALSVCLLGAGVVFERRDAYRNYGYGLVAGGWAGTYFTTYAMRAVPAAQIITSDVAGTAGLALVAAGMIGHSLRYRSQTVTGLAYVVAFVTLMLTPLRMFSLVATVPLAASLLVISQRLGWARTSVLGVAATYVVFVLRTQASGGPANPLALTPYLVLSAYWLTFEIADLVARRHGGDNAPTAAPLFALNAAGFFVSGLLQLPPDVRFMTWFATSSALVYLASAVVRSRLLGLRRTPSAGVATFTTTHGAVAIAAALALWSVDLQFAGIRETVGLLLVAELLFASGLALTDGHIRHMAAGAGGIATIHVLHLAGMAGAPLGPEAAFPAGWSGAALVLAAAWYGHREWIRARRLAPAALEYGYTWVGTWLIVLALVREFETARALLAVLAFAAMLVEAGLRRGPEYRWQGYGVGLGAGLLLSAVFGLGGASSSDAWTVLPLASALGYAVGVRLVRTTPETAGRGCLAAAGAAATLGSAFVALFQHEVLSAEMVGPAWSATAMALLLTGSLRHQPLLRWHAYALLVLGPGFAFGLVARPGDATTAELAGALVSFALAYAGTQVARRPIRASWPEGAEAPTEEAARVGLSVLMTLLVAALVALEAPDNSVTLLWGLAGLALLGIGFPVRDRVLRLSGLGLLLACILKLFVYDLRELEALPRIISFVALGLVLLAVSWTYTRFKDQLRRYL